DVWSATATPTTMAARGYFAYVWTGSQMIVWGGATAIAGTSGLKHDGADIDPAANAWYPVNNTSASLPVARGDAVAVWTSGADANANQMLVWGGINGTTTFLNNGAFYNPVTASWTTMSQGSTLAPRHAAGAIWTGST